MTDYLTAAILAAARLDDTAAVAHLAEHLGAAGYDARKLMREFPITLPALLADRPSLRAAVERSAGIAFDDAPPSPWHPYATREEWDAAVNETARRLGGPL
jgi:hypothetical protein